MSGLMSGKREPGAALSPKSLGRVSGLYKTAETAASLLAEFHLGPPKRDSAA